jgi:hypothetical protein
VTSQNTATLATWTDPGRGPTIPERPRLVAGFVGLVLGVFSANDPWYLLAGILALALITATPWEPES